MSKKIMNILFGFDNPKVEEYVISELEKLGIEVNSQVKSTKNTIISFVQSHPEFDHIILLEVMNRSRDPRLSRWEADEIAALTDDRDISVIVVLDESNKDVKHKGTEYMQILYAANILNAVYQSGKKTDNVVRDIVNLLVKTRTRKEAREYYGISDYIEIDFLSSSEFRTLYCRLYDEKIGETCDERFEKLCQKLNNEQIADFIRRMPGEMKKELSESDIYQRIYKNVSSEIIPCETAGVVSEVNNSNRGIIRQVRINKFHQKLTKNGESGRDELYSDDKKMMDDSENNLPIDTDEEMLKGNSDKDNLSSNTISEEIQRTNRKRNIANLLKKKPRDTDDSFIDTLYSDESEEVSTQQDTSEDSEMTEKMVKTNKQEDATKQSSIILKLFKMLAIILIITDVILGLYISNAFSFFANLFH